MVRNGEGLPDPDGPIVRVEFPDAQTVYAVARGRRQEADGVWFYELELPLCSAVEVRGRFTGEPSPVTFLAPAAKCTPAEGQSYQDLATERARSATPPAGGWCTAGTAMRAAASTVRPTTA